MQILKPKQNLSHIKFGHRLIHPLYSLQRSEKFSARIVVHDKDKEIPRLKRPVQLGKERVLTCGHDVLLIDDQFLLLVLENE